MTREQYIEAVKVKLEEISPFDEPASFIADDDDSANTVKPIKSYIEQSLDEAAHNCLLTLPLAFLHSDMVRQQPAMQIDGNGVGIISPFSSQNRLVRFRHPALLRDITSYITTEDPIYLLQQKKCTRGGIAKPVMVLASNAGGEDVTATTVGQLEIYSFPQDLNGTTDASGVLLYIPTDKHVGDTTHDEYIKIPSVGDEYFRFTGLPGDEYDGRTYGKRVNDVWYRGWRTTDNREVFTLGDDAPSLNDTVFAYISQTSSMQSVSQVSEYAAAHTDTNYVKSPIEELIVLECAAMVASILGDANTIQVCQQQQLAKIQSI